MMMMKQISSAIAVALLVTLCHGEPDPIESEMEDHWDQFLRVPLDRSAAAAGRSKRDTTVANDPKPDMDHHKTYDYLGHVIEAIRNKADCLSDIKTKWNISNFDPPNYQRGYYFKTHVSHNKHHSTEATTTDDETKETTTEKQQKKKTVYRYVHTKALISLPKACVWQCYAKKSKLVNEHGMLDYDIIANLFRPMGDSYVSSGRKVFDMCTRIVDEYPDYPFYIDFDTTHGIRDGYTVESCIKTVKMVLCNSAMGRGLIRA